MERSGYRGYESGVKRTVYHESNRAVWSMKRRFAILSMAACVALSGVVAGSGCGVRMGMEKTQAGQEAGRETAAGAGKAGGQKNLEGQ